MIIQLAGYPVIIDDHEKGAETQEELLFVAKLVRWILLNESDWTQVADSVLDADLKQEWVVFRQHLRDLPASFPSQFLDTIEIIDPPANAPQSWDTLKPR